jgi:hypothetical protein
MINVLRFDLENSADRRTAVHLVAGHFAGIKGQTALLPPDATPYAASHARREKSGQDRLETQPMIGDAESLRWAAMADMARHLAQSQERWDTNGLLREFNVVGHFAPYVLVIRKSDNVKGTLMFQRHPRVYFDFQPNDR